jgi:hypothetical protein
VISSEQELREWIDEHPKRHRKIGDYRCSCGWPEELQLTPEMGITWEQHERACLISDLGDALPSETTSAEGWYSWRENTNWLFECVDHLHQITDWWEKSAGDRLTDEERSQLDELWWPQDADRR